MKGCFARLKRQVKYFLFFAFGEAGFQIEFVTVSSCCVTAHPDFMNRIPCCPSLYFLNQLLPYTLPAQLLAHPPPDFQRALTPAGKYGSHESIRLPAVLRLPQNHYGFPEPAPAQCDSAFPQLTRGSQVGEPVGPAFRRHQKLFPG